MIEKSPEYPPLPPDDPKRNLTIAQPEIDQSLPHIGVVRVALEKPCKKR